MNTRVYRRTHVDTWNVHPVQRLNDLMIMGICSKNIPVSFNYVYQIVRSCIGLPDGDVDVVDLVLAEDGLDLVLVDVRQRHGVGDRDAALFLSADENRRGLFVQAYPEAFQLGLNEFLVAERLEDVEHDEDEVARPRNCGPV